MGLKARHCDTLLYSFAVSVVDLITCFTQPSSVLFQPCLPRLQVWIWTWTSSTSPSLCPEALVGERHARFKPVAIVTASAAEGLDLLCLTSRVLLRCICPPYCVPFTSLQPVAKASWRTKPKPSTQQPSAVSCPFLLPAFWAPFVLSFFLFFLPSFLLSFLFLLVFASASSFSLLLFRFASGTGEFQQAAGLQWCRGLFGGPHPARQGGGSGGADLPLFTAAVAVAFACCDCDQCAL